HGARRIQRLPTQVDKVEGDVALIPFLGHCETVCTIPKQPIQFIRHDMPYSAASNHLRNLLPASTGMERLCARHARVANNADDRKPTHRTIRAEFGFLRLQGNAFLSLLLGADAKIEYGGLRSSGLAGRAFHRRVSMGERISAFL